MVTTTNSPRVLPPRIRHPLVQKSSMLDVDLERSDLSGTVLAQADPSLGASQIASCGPR